MTENLDPWHAAGQYLPGGVCSSARLNKALGRPFYISRAAGSRVYDTDGKEYVDLCLSFGAALVGHAHPRVVDAVEQALGLGILCAYENDWHARLARTVAQTVPSIEMLRFSMSGTETTAYAVKLAREYTGRALIVKFEGHFHGFNDYLAYNYWPARGETWPQITPAMRGMPAHGRGNIVVIGVTTAAVTLHRRTSPPATEVMAAPCRSCSRARRSTSASVATTSPCRPRAASA